MMSSLISAVLSWQTLIGVLLVFGFAPGFVLRMLVLIYPKASPRRQELIAQLYTTPRWERPLFVAEQLETVLFEGTRARCRHLSRKRRDKSIPESLYRFLIPRALVAAWGSGMVTAFALRLIFPQFTVASLDLNTLLISVLCTAPLPLAYVLLQYRRWHRCHGRRPRHAR